MKCYICQQDYSFICHCSEKFICKIHLGDHLGLEGDHKYEKLTMTFDPIEKSFFQKDLENRISLLTHLKISLITQTKDIIKYIKSQNSIQIKKLNNQITELLLLSKKEEFLISDQFKMRSQLMTELLIKPLNTSKVLKSIKEFYSNDFFTSSIEPSKEKFLKSLTFLDKHNGGFRCLAVSNDCKLVITGSEDTTVRIWDLQSKMQLACLAEHKSDILCLDISQDCKKAVSGSFDKTLVLWNIETLSVQQVFYGHSGAVVAASFVLGQKSLVSVSSAKEMLIWSLESLKCLKKIETLSFINCGISIQGQIFLAGTNNSLEIWDLKAGSQSSIKAHEKPVRSVAVTSDQKLAATSSDDRSVKVWELSSASLYADFLGHSEAVLTVSVTSDDKFLVSGSSNQVIIVWSLELKEKVHEMNFHSSIVYGIRTVRDLIISVSSDSRIGLVSLPGFNFDGFFCSTPFEFRSVMFKENLVVFGSLNDVVVWDFTCRNKDLVLKGHQSQVKSTCITESLNFVVSAARGTVKNLIVWSLKSQTVHAELNGHLETVFSVDCSKDEELIVSGGGDGKVIIWNLNAKKIEFSLEGHLAPVDSVKFTKNKRVVSGGRDGKVFVWDLNRKNQILVVSAFNEKIFITCDDKFAVAVSPQKGASVLDLIGLKQKNSFKNWNEANSFFENYRDLKFDLSRYLF